MWLKLCWGYCDAPLPCSLLLCNELNYCSVNWCVWGRYGEAYSWQYVNCCIHNIIVGTIWIEHVSKFVHFCLQIMHLNFLNKNTVLNNNIDWQCLTDVLNGDLFVYFLLFVVIGIFKLFFDFDYFSWCYEFGYSYVRFVVCCHAVWCDGSYKSQIITEVGCQLQSVQLVRQRPSQSRRISVW